MDDSAPPVVVAEVKWTIPCQGQGRVGRPAPCPAKQGRLGRLDNTLLQQGVTQSTQSTETGMFYH